MIEGKHVIRQIAEAAHEVMRRAPVEELAVDFAKDAHAAIDARLTAIRKKSKGRWAEAKKAMKQACVDALARSKPVAQALSDLIADAKKAKLHDAARAAEPHLASLQGVVKPAADKAKGDRALGARDAGRAVVHATADASSARDRLQSALDKHVADRRAKKDGEAA